MGIRVAQTSHRASARPFEGATKWECILQWCPTSGRSLPLASYRRGAPSCEPYDVCCWQIVLQKSKVAGPQIFRQMTERQTVADSHSLNGIIEVAREFIVRR